MLCNAANNSGNIYYSQDAYGATKPVPDVPSSFDKGHELFGPEFQNADYNYQIVTAGALPPLKPDPAAGLGGGGASAHVDLLNRSSLVAGCARAGYSDEFLTPEEDAELRQRPHPGPGYHTCKLFQAGLCNNFSAFPDKFRRGDPMGQWGLHGVCEECFLRRNDLKRRGLPVDYGNEGSPLKRKMEGNFPALMPIVPSFDREPIRTVVFFGDFMTPRLTELKGQQVSLQTFSDIQYTHRLAQDAQGRWRRVRRDVPNSPGGNRGQAMGSPGSRYPTTLGASSVAQDRRINLNRSAPCIAKVARNKGKYVDVYDETHFLCSAQELCAGVFEHYQRDVTGRVSPGLLTLMHNLDPDLVVISGGHLDLTEGVSAKDVFVATKILGEQALLVPRKDHRLPERKIIFMGIPITPTLKAFPDMVRRRAIVLQRLTHMQRVDHRIKVLQCFEGKQVSGGHFTRPNSYLTQAEHDIAVNCILNNIRVEGTPVRDGSLLERSLVDGGPEYEDAPYEAPPSDTERDQELNRDSTTGNKVTRNSNATAGNGKNGTAGDQDPAVVLAQDDATSPNNEGVEDSTAAVVNEDDDVLAPTLLQDADLGSSAKTNQLDGTLVSKSDADVVTDEVVAS
ncbi:unnamed protein product [Amoebophrya sp. A25]|nr:unnamed protein product [Amoebophrya sp. A25]|eukprot:GSA25T00016522001.1